MQVLERYKGHFFNWYSTETLLPLNPRYVSTVDSGNLAASLLTLKEGLTSLKSQPLLRPEMYEGLFDTIGVIAEKTKSSGVLQKVKSNFIALEFKDQLTLSSTFTFLEKLLTAANEVKANLDPIVENEVYWWINVLANQCSDVFDEMTQLTSWIDDIQQSSKFIEIVPVIPAIPSINDILHISGFLLPELEKAISQVSAPEGKEWLLTLQTKISIARSMAESMLETIDSQTEQCNELSDYQYDFLFDEVQHLLTIGYNVEEHRRDAGYYDLLGSESRLSVYVAIAEGKIPQDSWFALGRQLTNAGEHPALISWSGSMFEYLMPTLIAPVYDGTLLDQTQKGAVRRHIEYGKRRGLPWGSSESCFNMVHANMDYMYKAFGVPGLGLKRGLGDDYVVAPYASIMALMVEPEEAYDNLKSMASLGFEGRWGFYEAIDYTPARLQRGQTESVVKAFMTHHQGMGLLSLAYVLCDQPMQKRFQADLQFQTSLLLLQEKIPQVSTFFSPIIDVTDIPSEPVNTELRVIPTANTPIPEVQLLSNGRYHVMVSNAGSGYSRWKDIAVSRWHEDSTCDHWGSFCFIRDLESGEFWSAGHQPTLKQADHYEVIYSQGRAEIRRRDYNIDAHIEIVVSPEDDAECRRLHITNRSRRRRQLEFTSYTEVVLNSGIADMLHPAFSNLFVQTEIIPESHGIMCTRRPRSAEEHPLWMFHLMKVHGTTPQEIAYETSRDQFIGRGNTISSPQALMQKESLSGTQGSVLDPIAAIQYRVTIMPYETITIDMLYGVSQTKEECERQMGKYQDKHMIDRAFELAWTHSQVVLRQINATAMDALMYCKMAGSIIYANASYRADPAIIVKNQRAQSGLWSHSISGDYPIVLLQIEDSTNIELVRNLVQAHSFWRQKGLIVDLVIWNEDHGGYRQVLQNQILSLIAPAHIAEEQDQPGSIFIRSSEQLSNEDRILFQTVARVIISDKLGTLDGQLSRRKKLKPVVSNFIPQKNHQAIETAIEVPGDLLFENGIGGFSQNGKEYVITTKPDQVTPAPWSNVIANAQFGTVISESGQSYTWFQNAHEERLTPWHNDPVTDQGGEHFYIRDEETGHFWSPSPLPARGKSAYITRHGFGYSIFEHIEGGIYTEMKVFVDADKPIKYTVISIHNRSGKARQLSATGYVEWVLGDLRHKTKMHVITEVDLNSDAIIATNSYSTEFRRLVAFFDVNDAGRTITTDREEFFGRNGTAKNPEALRKSKLSGRTGAALDPCGVIQVALNLEDGEKKEIVFRLGAATQIEDISYFINQGRGKTAAKEALQNVMRYWGKSLSVINIESPDAATNILTNGWLNYQTLACRLWARSGYYQSGGAFGFRDQLQDVLSLLHNEPTLARQQIVLCASRQFVEGDVQHWWHPPAGRGVRTRCSDDYLWLPYVTSSYILVTGDASILDEQVQFLESRALGREEHSYYDMPVRSDLSASLYQHCVKAIEYGLQFGIHGLPLMGAGDWNDGMDRVGLEGKGE
ncbi:MAG TPA: glucoamylase family protein, partial [Saprospiraceae bacterium]